MPRDNTKIIKVLSILFIVLFFVDSLSYLLAGSSFHSKKSIESVIKNNITNQSFSDYSKKYKADLKNSTASVFSYWFQYYSILGLVFSLFALYCSISLLRRKIWSRSAIIYILQAKVVIAVVVFSYKIKATNTILDMIKNSDFEIEVLENKLLYTDILSGVKLVLIIIFFILVIRFLKMPNTIEHFEGRGSKGD